MYYSRQMTPFGYLVFAVVSLAGWMMFAQGRRGRRIDDHPVCAKCKFDLTGRNAANGSGRAVFMKADELVGQHADITLRPSFTAAGHTANINKLLDHEFVFKDVLIGKP